MSPRFTEDERKALLKARFPLINKIAKDCELPGAAKSLATVLLFEHFDERKGFAWPSRRRLAEQLGVDVKTITRSWQRLQEHQYFVVQENKGRGANNKYVPAFVCDMCADKLPWLGALLREGHSGPEKGDIPVTRPLPSTPSKSSSSTSSTRSAALSERTDSLPARGSSSSGTAEATEPSGPAELSASLEAAGQSREREEHRDATADVRQYELRVFGTMGQLVNYAREPMKSAEWWRERDRQSEIAKLPPDEQVAAWLKALGGDK